MKRIVLASILGLGLVSPMIPAQAAPLAPVQSQSFGSNDLLQEAASRSHYQGNNKNNHRMRTSWDRNRDGNRCRSRTNSCRHYHNGYWYATPWWTLPLLGGAVILNLDNKHTNRHYYNH